MLVYWRVSILQNAELRRLAEDSKIIDALQGMGAPILIAGQEFDQPRSP